MASTKPAGGPPLKSPVLLSGFPNMRNVSKLAVMSLLEEWKPEPLREVASEHLADAPPRIAIEEGVGRLVKYGYYVVRGRVPRELVLVTGDTQPASAEGYHAVCAEILGTAVQMGVGRIYTVGSMGVPWEPKAPKVTAVANTPEAMAELKAAGVGPCADGGPITGLEALLPAYARFYDIPAALLLAETQWDPSTFQVPDPRAARAGVEALGKLVGGPLPVGWLDRMAEELARARKKAHEESEAEAGEKEPEVPGYR